MGIQTQNLSYRYKSSQENSLDVLDDVSLTVKPGTVISLLGPSGCGKTTLLRTIAGLERPDHGVIIVGDQIMAGPNKWVPPERRKIGMVFQNWALFPHLSVADNVGYGVDQPGLNWRKRSKAYSELRQRIQQSLTMVGLSGFEDRMPQTLSGGQQQRVALARALAPHPSVLLLDEPFSNLDTSLRSEIRSEVRQLLTELAITTLFVTHDQTEAFVIGDQIAVMNQGCIEQLGSPQDLYNNPVNRWVAEFVGEATHLPGEANGKEVRTALGTLPLSKSLIGPVDVLIRPEQLTLEFASDNDPSSGLVELIEYHGHDAIVSVGQTQPQLVNGQSQRSISVRTGADPGVHRGDRVKVRFSGDWVNAYSTTSPDQ